MYCVVSCLIIGKEISSTWLFWRDNVWLLPEENELFHYVFPVRCGKESFKKNKILFWSYLLKVWSLFKKILACLLSFNPIWWFACAMKHKIMRNFFFLRFLLKFLSSNDGLSNTSMFPSGYTLFYYTKSVARDLMRIRNYLIVYLRKEVAQHSDLTEHKSSLSFFYKKLLKKSSAMHKQFTKRTSPLIIQISAFINALNASFIRSHKCAQ